MTVGKQCRRPPPPLPGAEFDPSSFLGQGDLGIGLHAPGDVGAPCAAFRKNGAEFSRPATKESWGGWARVMGPYGVEISLMPADP